MPETKLLTKGTLVTVSHALERAALAAAEDGPMLVVALFQRLPYFERERGVYERIARSAAVTVVGLVGDQALDLPAGSHLVALTDDEAYAREWSVTVLTPRFGAVLVAHDREEVTGTAATLEGGRLFDGWWSLRRDDALRKALELQSAFADRLAPAARTSVAEVLTYVRDVAPGAGESRADAVMRLLVERAERTGSALAELRGRAEAPGRSAVAGPEEIRRWSGADGVTASGTLPVALVAVRVPPAHQLPEQAGRRGEALRNEGLIGVLSAVLRDADRVTRLGPDDFLLMLPAMAFADAVKVAHRLHDELVNGATHNPFLPREANLVVMTTRHRPFPVDRLRQALDWARRENVPVARLDS